MKAYNIKSYGEPAKVLKLIETAQPIPNNTEVQVKVCATTINDYDWCITTGKPFSYRLFFGIFSPRKKLIIPGMEFSGIVVQVGNNVTMFKAGDAVYGDISQFGFGSFADFLCIDEKALARKPDRRFLHGSNLADSGIVMVDGGGGFFLIPIDFQ